VIGFRVLQYKVQSKALGVGGIFELEQPVKLLQVEMPEQRADGVVEKQREKGLHAGKINRYDLAGKEARLNLIEKLLSLFCGNASLSDKLAEFYVHGSLH
jgi:hypothetical protein